MFRTTLVHAQSALKSAVKFPKTSCVTSGVRYMSKHSTETDEQFDNRYEAYFNKQDIDGWEIRKGINDLCGLDVVPEPKIIEAAIRACRRVNDYSLAVRFLEAIKDKCGPRVDVIYPYIIQEIRPVITELGVDTPEELGIDKPELALEDLSEVH